MAGVIGFWFAVVGGIAALAGLTARRRVVRLRRSGQSAWGRIVPSPVSLGEADGWPRRNLIQYSLTDGRVIERICPRPVRKTTSPSVGERVHVWYDPADPTDVLVNGWGRTWRSWRRACSSSSSAWESRSVTERRRP